MVDRAAWCTSNVYACSPVCSILRFALINGWWCPPTKLPKMGVAHVHTEKGEATLVHSLGHPVENTLVILPQWVKVIQMLLEKAWQRSDWRSISATQRENLQPGHGDGFQTQLQLLATQIALSLTFGAKKGWHTHWTPDDLNISNGACTCRFPMNIYQHLSIFIPTPTKSGP